MDEKIEDLLSRMTLEEKVSMVAGSDAWHTTPVERLQIPALKVTDGPHGARGASFRGGPSCVSFPAGIALASTWNPELIGRVGRVLGQETKTKGAQVLLGPTVNIHRSPLNGRNFECYSEDPYLTARIAVAFINGVKEENIGTSIKHYVCNESEFERFTISSEVHERALREIYLPPFEAAVKEADTWSVMASYNRINGVYASENKHTLMDILKQEWGFRGFVVSDWGGTRSTADAANAGLDLEMPGPARMMGDKLLEAVKAGEVDESVIDDKVRRLLRVMVLSGVFESPEEPPEQAVDKPEHRSLAREVAGEGIVLLKNRDHVLPLDKSKVGSLAIIGPNAKVARIMGGGSSVVTPHYAITPFDGIRNRMGDSSRVLYEQGCDNYRTLPVIEPGWLRPSGDAEGEGLTVEYFNAPDLAGEPVFASKRTYMEMAWTEEISPEVNRESFSARFTGTILPPETGTYQFSLVSVGLSRLCIDGTQVIDNWTDQTPGEYMFGTGSKEVVAELSLSKGQGAEITVEYAKPQEAALAALRLGCAPLLPEDAVERAARIAGDADVALLFVGSSDEWETEGRDRPDMELPGKQVELIEKVAEANERTVVVLNTGSPITMNWIDRVAGVVQAWFPGQECGNAIADVLFGWVNPSGKLPQTFPRRLEDNPAYINYPGENGKVYYGEGIFVGYRYYDKKKIAPLFPFGYGLSYTTFEYGDLRLSAQEYDPGDEIEAVVAITNTGEREGKEAVQLYVRDPESRLVRPEKELKAFQKVLLKPGETKSAVFRLKSDALSFYDPEQGNWVAEPGEFELLIGSSSRDIRARGSFLLKPGDGSP